MLRERDGDERDNKVGCERRCAGAGAPEARAFRAVDLLRLRRWSGEIKGQQKGGGVMPQCRKTHLRPVVT